MRFFQRCVAVLLLAWLPVQAAALPALVLLCEQEQTSAESHGVVVAAHGHHDGAGHHQHVDGDDEGGSAPHDHGNGCCHHLFSAALPVSLDAPRESGLPLDLTPLSSLSSFFPEQPQRPPLA
jgi:hypothetical protein